MTSSPHGKGNIEAVPREERSAGQRGMNSGGQFWAEQACRRALSSVRGIV